MTVGFLSQRTRNAEPLYMSWHFTQELRCYFAEGCFLFYSFMIKVAYSFQRAGSSLTKFWPVWNNDDDPIVLCRKHRASHSSTNDDSLKIQWNAVITRSNLSRYYIWPTFHIWIHIWITPPPPPPHTHTHTRTRTHLTHTQRSLICGHMYYTDQSYICVKAIIRCVNVCSQQWRYIS